MKNIHTTTDNNNIDSPEAPFLRAIFNAFNSNNYKYCVLRNYTHLPYSADGHDVDVLVAKISFRSCCNEAESVASRLNVKLISVVESYNVNDLAFIGKNESNWWGVRFDIMGYVGTNAVPILPTATFLDRAYTHNSISVANQNDAALLAFFKDIIGSGKDKKNYRIEANNAFKNKMNDYLVRLNEEFGGCLNNDNINNEFFLNEDTYIESQKLLRNASTQSQIKKSPIQYLQWKFADFIYRCKRLIRPPGYCVAIIGTDGAGKSTIIDSIRKPIESALHNPIYYEHMRPNLLPSLAKLLGGKVEDGPVSNPHASTSSGFLGSLIRLSYYTIDYVIGYWFKVRLVIARRPCLFVFDRYFYDYIIDPHRSRVSLPRWIIQAYGLLVPNPDLIICLGADPDIIHTRKPELALEEVERQVAALKIFCDKQNNTIWIDTGVSIEESSDQVLQAITDRMSERYKSKFNA